MQNAKVQAVCFQGTILPSRRWVVENGSCIASLQQLVEDTKSTPDPSNEKLADAIFVRRDM